MCPSIVDIQCATAVLGEEKKKKKIEETKPQSKNIMSDLPTSVPSGILVHPAGWPQQTWAKIGGFI